MDLKVKRLTETAKLPTKAHVEDAGWDLYTNEDVTVGIGETKRVKTGVAIVIPSGYCGFIKPRSGLYYDGFDTDGTIDSGYSGEVMIQLRNLSGKPTFFAAGYRLAQLVLADCQAYTKLLEVTELDETKRGDKGFGSSGIT